MGNAARAEDGDTASFSITGARVSRTNMPPTVALSTALVRSGAAATRCDRWTLRAVGLQDWRLIDHGDASQRRRCATWSALSLQSKTPQREYPTTALAFPA
jgi:hypothetical protein